MRTTGIIVLAGQVRMRSEHGEMGLREHVARLVNIYLRPCAKCTLCTRAKERQIWRFSSVFLQSVSLI